MDSVSTFTSTGAKFFAHQEAMRGLRDGRGRPIVTHLMPTDICQHTCAFCSVQTRVGETLLFSDMMEYLDILVPLGLKAVIISGGGNPLLYRDPVTSKNISDLILAIRNRGLEIGLITNGQPVTEVDGRRVWRSLRAEAMDACSWIRLSLAGLDHDGKVGVPDVDRSKTTLGFSYVFHDIYEEPLDKNHGKVSTLRDLVDPTAKRTILTADSRIPELVDQIGYLVKEHRPAYVRLLPNCLEPEKIDARIQTLQDMANRIDPTIVFVQYKPPSAPKACYLGYIHPVLNSDGYVYPCDSCVLNEKADHKFAASWRVCEWRDVGKLYAEPVRSLIKDPSTQCPGCVFPKSNAILAGVVDGRVSLAPPEGPIQHVNFV